MAGSANMKKRRIARREAAQARQNIRDERSTEEQIVLIRSRPGNSARELARLEASQ